MVKQLIIDNWNWTDAYNLEAQFRSIISEQASYGWKIDMDRLKEVKKDITNKHTILYKCVQDMSSKVVTKQGELKKPIKNDGSPNQYAINWWNKLGSDRVRPISEVVGSFSRIKMDKINPNSWKQRNRELFKHGWIPTEWNYKTDRFGKTVYIDKKPVPTSPKLTADSVLRIPIGEVMKEYTQIQHRYTTVNGILERLRDDETIPMDGDTAAAVTGRVRHRGTVNIPRKSTFYGQEIRSLFSHREGYILLGADLKTLELRLQAHYSYEIDNGEWANRVIGTCAHENTVELFKETGIDRGIAKTANYALGFGCGVKKLSVILDCSEPVASRLKEVWWNDKRPLVTLTEDLKACSDRRSPLWIKGLDGRKIFARNSKDLLNMLIQSAGSVVNKFINVEIDKQLKEKGLSDIHQVYNSHDEVNFELREKDIDILKEILYNSIRTCNNHFDFKVPMDMDIKIGLNWSEIH